eukprot:3750880-Amphidinium_carterae.1
MLTQAETAVEKLSCGSHLMCAKHNQKNQSASMNPFIFACAMIVAYYSHPSCKVKSAGGILVTASNHSPKVYNTWIATKDVPCDWHRNSGFTAGPVSHGNDAVVTTVKCLAQQVQYYCSHKFHLHASAWVVRPARICFQDLMPRIALALGGLMHPCKQALRPTSRQRCLAPLLASGPVPIH